MSPSCHQLINPIFTEQQQHNLTSILRLLAKVAKVKRWSDILDDHKKRQMTNKQTNRQTESAPLLFFPLTGNRHCHEDHTLPRSRVRVENGYSERERRQIVTDTGILSHQLHNRQHYHHSNHTAIIARLKTAPNAAEQRGRETLQIEH